MKYFNIAADFKKETIDGYDRLNQTYTDSRIIETYGNITVGNHFEGGRVMADIPKIDLEALQSYIAYSRSKGIDFNYSLNGSCMGNREFTEVGANELYRFLTRLHQAGVTRLTVSIPSVMELVKSMNLGFEIKVSIICQITNANKAISYKNTGVDRLVVDESLNRDFEKLRQVREAFGEKTEIIANSMCYKDCTFRMFHYNQTAHDSVNNHIESINTYYNHRCMLKRAEEPGNFLKLCWVRPEDLKHYVKIGIQYFKIQGRHTAFKGDPVRAAEAYCKESYEGNLIDLMELFSTPYAFKINLDNRKLEGYLQPFIDNPHFCKRYCAKCGYCDAFARKHLDYGAAQEINQLAVRFYHDYDQFSDMLRQLRQPESKPLLAAGCSDEQDDFGF